jgi:hypothetical protein
MLVFGSEAKEEKSAIFVSLGSKKGLLARSASAKMAAK